MRPGDSWTSQLPALSKCFKGREKKTSDIQRLLTSAEHTGTCLEYLHTMTHLCIHKHLRAETV